MKKLRLIGASCAVVFSLITLPSQAALIGVLPATPGGTDWQAAYDDVLDITWLTDAGLSGGNTWDNQLTWVSDLNAANHLGFNDWRLASISVAAGLPTGTTNSSVDVIDCNSATELDCRDNELGYMYHHNMGGSQLDDKTGNQTVDGVLLTDVQSIYWSGTDLSPNDQAWTFIYQGGGQTTLDEISGLHGWAVCAGDVSAVPVPAAVWLFGSGLLGLVGMARRKKA